MVIDDEVPGLLAPLLACVALFGQAAVAEERGAERRITIGCVALAENPRYAHESGYAGTAFRRLGRPLPGGSGMRARSAVLWHLEF